MSEKKFTCVLGKDYHIINNNVDNMTYYLQDGNDVVLVINLLNKLYEENEQLQEKNKQIGYLKRDLFILINLIRDTPMEFNCDFEKIVERWE